MLTDSEDTGPDRPGGDAGEPVVDIDRQRRIRRRQTALAIAALLAIVAFALIQGFIGAPDKIPGTH